MQQKHLDYQKRWQSNTQERLEQWQKRSDFQSNRLMIWEQVLLLWQEMLHHFIICHKMKRIQNLNQYSLVKQNH